MYTYTYDVYIYIHMSIYIYIYIVHFFSNLPIFPSQMAELHQVPWQLVDNPGRCHCHESTVPVLVISGQHTIKTYAERWTFTMNLNTGMSSPGRVSTHDFLLENE